MNRRQFIATTGSLAMSAQLGLAANASGTDNVIQKENAKTGTRDWMLAKTAIDPKTKYRCPWIEGY